MSSLTMRSRGLGTMLNDGYLIGIAKASIWAFFLLIVDETLTLAGFKFELPIHPIVFYGLISAGLFVTATLIDGTLEHLKDAGLFFVAFAILVILGCAMYRGEGVGPDFNGLLLVESYRPSNAGYMLWPVLNLFAGAGLYLFARHKEFRQTIIAAAMAALILQASAMEADMWWPAIFGDANGRAGGFAQNANVAALLVTILACLMLPALPGDRPNRFCIYAIMIAFAVVLLSQSRFGGVVALTCLASFIFAVRKSAMAWPAPAFTVCLVAGLVGTIWLSPTLNPTADQIESAKIARAALMQKHAKHDDSVKFQLPPGTLDAPVTLTERMESRASMDGSVELRRNALAFYFKILKDNPFGIGTGFTNKFMTGPHNVWLKLAVDEGFIAPILLLILLAAASWQTIRTRSPALLAIMPIAWITSVFFHTLVVDPIILPAIAIGLGMIKTPVEDRRGKVCARDQIATSCGT